MGPTPSRKRGERFAVLDGPPSFLSDVTSICCWPCRPAALLGALALGTLRARRRRAAARPAGV